jgi:neutral trehalase
MTTTDPNEFEHFPCDCHRPEHAYTDSLCPMCEEEREREREAKRNGEHAEPESTKRTQEDAEREIAMQGFLDACQSMTREDWDADNAWLESAGWGEM